MSHNGNFLDDHRVLVSGFIDLHCHGAVGVDVNGATAVELLSVGEFLASKGVAAWLPTLVPDSDEAYMRVISAIDEAMERQAGTAAAQIAGVHYEGIFANEKMCGALRPQFFRDGRWLADGGRLPKLKRGVHMTTMAPEIDGGIDVVKHLVSDDWVVSIGHTRANVDTLDAAFDAGARHITHFYNAMTGIHHRDLGVAGWALTKKGVSIDIIADGIHVEPRMLKLACGQKGVDDVCLISDSVAPTGLGDGKFELWGETVEVVNGRTRNERGSIAGSVITMMDAVRQMLELGYSEDDVRKMACENPARVAGISLDA